MRGDRAAGHDQQHGEEDERHAGYDARRELLAEDRDAEEERRDGLQRPEDRRGRRADAVDGRSHGHERQDGREQCQRHGVDPQCGRRHGLQVEPQAQAHHVDAQTEQQRIEGELLGRERGQRRAVDPHDVDRIAERREEDQRDARHRERLPVAAPVEQPHAGQRQQDGDEGGCRSPLAEAHGHDCRHQQRIEEQQRGGDTGGHVSVAQEEEERREGEEQPHGRQGQDLRAADGERLPPDEHEPSQHRHGQHIAVEEHRVGTEARLVERQGEERVQTIECGGYGAERVAAAFRTLHRQNATLGAASAPSAASK